MTADHRVGDQQAVEPGPVGAEQEGDREHEGRGDEGAQAGRDDQAAEQHPARSGGDEQPVEPALLDVAGQVDPGRGAGEAGPLQHADRHEEARVAVGGEAGQLGEAAEDAVEPEEEDRRRQHAGDRRPRHPQQLVLGARDQRADRRRCAARTRLSLPSLSRWRRARALSTSERAMMPAIASAAPQHVGGVHPGDDRLADPFDDEAERVVLGDRLRRLDHQALREEGSGEEEDDEDQREKALDDARPAGAQGDRGADPADRHRRGRDQGDRDQRSQHAALDLGAEDQPDRQEPERREERPAPRSPPAARGRS